MDHSVYTFFRNSPTGQILLPILRAMAQTTRSYARMCVLRVKKLKLIFNILF